MDIVGEENEKSLIKSRDGIPVPKEICTVLAGLSSQCFRFREWPVFSDGTLLWLGFDQLV
jgi:hypothetical protein